MYILVTFMFQVFISCGITKGDAMVCARAVRISTNSFSDFKTRPFSTDRLLKQALGSLNARRDLGIAGHLVSKEKRYKKTILLKRIETALFFNLIS